jgi:hypothetical protein
MPPPKTMTTSFGEIVSIGTGGLRGSGPQCPDFNEPYTTVSLALAAMAASASSDRSAVVPRLLAWWCLALQRGLVGLWLLAMDSPRLDLLDLRLTRMSGV